MGDPVDGHDVVADGEDGGLDDVEMGGVGGVGGEIVLVVVAAVEEVGKMEGGGSVSVEGAGREMEDGG